MRFTKNASLNLSINAIVILILAITMLGLGLGFMRNIFGSATEEFTKVGGTVQKQMVDQMKETNKIVDISRPKIVIKQGNKDQVYLGFKNTQAGTSTFSIQSVSGFPLTGSTQVTIPSCAQTGTPDVELRYKSDPTTVEAGETTVLPLNVVVKPNTAEGTCFFDISIEVSPTGSTPQTKHLELTVDVTI